MQVYQILSYFFVYGFLGWCTEVAFAAVKERRFVNRGFLNGPICPIYGIGVSTVICFLTPLKENWVLLYVLSVILVSAIEWLTGFLLEKIFHNKWWDYSSMPLNLNGYICLPFSIVWGFFCMLIVYVVHPLIARGIEWIPVIVGIAALVVLLIVMFADLYVTAAGIFKMNHRLEHMEYIAGELHEISDNLGENIYKNVIEMLEKQETTKQKLDEAAQELNERKLEFDERRQEVSEDMKARINELRSMQKELVENLTVRGKTARRLLEAFPTMESQQHKKSIEELRKRFLKNKKSK